MIHKVEIESSLVVTVPYIISPSSCRFLVTPFIINKHVLCTTIPVHYKQTRIVHQNGMEEEPILTLRHNYFLSVTVMILHTPRLIVQNHCQYYVIIDIQHKIKILVHDAILSSSDVHSM